MKGNPQAISKRYLVTSNMEDYLEAIYDIMSERDAQAVRVSDIARKLKVTRPSVVGMIRHLTEHGLVEHNHYGRVNLTEEGASIARDMYHRHQVLKRFLTEVLGLSSQVAEDDACRIEHTLSPETIDRFIALEEFREQSPEALSPATALFKSFLKKRKPVK